MDIIITIILLLLFGIIFGVLATIAVIFWEKKKAANNVVGSVIKKAEKMTIDECLTCEFTSGKSGSFVKECPGCGRNLFV